MPKHLRRLTHNLKHLIHPTPSEIQRLHSNYLDTLSHLHQHQQLIAKFDLATVLRIFARLQRQWQAVVVRGASGEAVRDLEPHVRYIKWMADDDLGKLKEKEEKYREWVKEWGERWIEARERAWGEVKIK